MGYEAPLSGHLVDRASKGSAYLTNQESDSTRRYWIPATYVAQVLDKLLEKPPTDLKLLRACTYTVLQFCWICRSDTGTAAKMPHVVVDEGDIVLKAVKLKGRGADKWAPVYKIPAGAVDGLTPLILRWIARKRSWKLVGASHSFWSIPGETGRYTSSHGDDWVKLALTSVGATPPEGFHFNGHSTRSGAATGASSVGAPDRKICFMADWSPRANSIETYVDPTAQPTQAARRFFGWLAPPLTHGTS